VCDLEAIGAPSIFKVIRKTASLARMLTTVPVDCALCFGRPDRNLLVGVFVSRTTVSVERLTTRPDHAEHVLVLSRVVSSLMTRPYCYFSVLEK